MQMRRKSFWSILAVLFSGALLMVATGCPTTDTPPKLKNVDAGTGDADQGDQCTKPEDCPVGLQCIRGTCQKTSGCRDNDDCPGTRICKAGSCYKPEPDVVEDTGMDTGVVDTGDPPGDTSGDTMTGDTRGREDAKNCMGCILPADAGGMASGACVSGTDKEACGSGGEMCSICGADELCDNGSCQPKPCTPQNCQGCCKNGQCVQGDSDTACGEGGDACDTCSGDAVCQDGSCEVPCGPGSCNGCCSASGQCQGGMSDSSCGSNGDMCTSCGTDEKCSNGKCVKLACSQTCNGCCSGQSCQSGNSDSACGSGGDSCRSCSNGFACSFGRCGLDGNSRWDIVAVSGEVPNTDENSVFWDNRYNKPDVFAKITVNGYAGRTKSGKTSVDEGDLTPFWYETTVSGALAKDIKGYNNVTVELIDEDPWYSGGNTTISKCEIDFDPRHFGSSSTTFDCKGSRPVDAKIKLRLTYHP